MHRDSWFIYSDSVVTPEDDMKSSSMVKGLGLCSKISGNPANSSMSMVQNVSIVGELNSSDPQ
jgi:hypothetical protein